MQKGINVLSLFDGMSCGQIALERAGIKVNQYFASEIDKYAIQVTQHNYPKTIQLGSVVDVCDMVLPDIDLLIGGSPCQGFSFAGKQLNFDDPRSKLFFEYVRILNQLRARNPNMFFLMENVRMKQESQNVISELLGVEPMIINSALVSAQNRKRLYWTNIPNVKQPGDRKIFLRDVLETEGIGVIKNHGALKEMNSKSMCLDASYYKGADNHGQRTMILEDKALTLTSTYRHNPSINDYLVKRNKQMVPVSEVVVIGQINSSQDGKVVAANGKAPCLVAGHNNQPKVALEHYLNEKELERSQVQYAGKIWKSGNRMGNMKFPNDPDKKAKTLTVVNTKGGRETNHVHDTYYYRKLTPIECERLQTAPDNYTAVVSNSQRYKMLGNGWTVEVAAHIFSYLPYVI